MHYLNPLEEAIGILLAINVCENSLFVNLDSAQFIIDSLPTRSLELAREQLLPYVGKKIAVLRDTDTTKPLYIRLAAQNSKAIIGEHK
jgi:hypothetical protein